MNQFFFNGSSSTKLDEKNRFVLPQQMRYGLIENGVLEFTMALGLGGCLSIYRKSDIEKIVQKFKEKEHMAKYQKFFTLFFSTLHPLTCDKLGRVLLPPLLKKTAHIQSEIVICGVLSKIEVWPREKYELDLESYLSGGAREAPLVKMMEEVFGLLDGEKLAKEEPQLAKLSDKEEVEYQGI